MGVEGEEFEWCSTGVWRGGAGVICARAGTGDGEELGGIGGWWR